MPNATPRGRPVDRRKDEAILRAVRRVLQRDGPSAVTMERIAHEAAVSKATLYRRYPSRQALLEALVNRDAERVFRALLQPTAGPGGVRTQLEAFVVDLAGLLCGPDHRRYLQALGDLPRAGVDLQGIWRRGPAQAHGRLAAFLASAHANGHLHCDDPAAAAELLLGMAVGLDLVRSLYRVPQQRYRLAARRTHAEYVVDLFLRCYAPENRATDP
ncbi:TetR/AcrR family transcriptional regulator [uncultured Tepidimonas sp.]|uniref:TetR/AcrR family transcriptional regulator n=1 Tax=uncultured Tepidimonas sp. TaxID=453579 RepID=UPI002606461B|nr:TetR/AcrR family transcriptional regulator [uncultured Tepidimonas sp.]